MSTVAVRISAVLCLVFGPLFAIARPTSPVPLSACDLRILERVQDLTARQLNWYQAHGNVVPAEAKHSIYRPGTNGRAILLVHGFMSSPEGVTELADALNAKGYAVLSPLITGFGADHRAANAARILEWEYTLQQAAETLGLCFPRIAMVGHSLGAALSVNYVQSRMGPTGPRVTHLIGLAPYIRVYFASLPPFVDALRQHGSTVSPRLIRLLLHQEPSEILPIPPYLLDKDYRFPLDAADRVFNFRERFKMTRAPGDKIDTSALIVYSGFDFVVDGKYAARYFNSVFKSVDHLYYDRQQRISHFLNQPKHNPSFEQMVERLVLHLEK